MYPPYTLSKCFSLRPIDWSQLSMNQSEGAIRLLEANQDKIDGYYLSQNESEGAIRLLEANPDKIRWSFISE